MAKHAAWGRPMGWRRAAAVAATLALLAGGAGAGEAPPAGPSVPVEKNHPVTGRPLVVQNLRRLKSPFVNERLDAIQTLGQQTDIDVINALGVPAELGAIARNAATFDRERLAALQALTTMFENGVPLPNLLDTIIGVIESETGERIRVDALGVAARVLSTYPAGDAHRASLKRAHDGLRRLWDNRAPRGQAPMPPAAQAALLGAVAEINGRDFVPTVAAILSQSLDDPSPVVRIGGLTGLRRFVERNQINDRKLSERLIQLCRDAANRRERDVLATGLGALETMATINPRLLEQAGAFRQSLYDVLHTGDDTLVTAVARLLMFLADVDTVTHLIQESRPRPTGETQLSVDTHVVLARALVECLQPMLKRIQTLEGERIPNQEMVNAARESANGIAMHLRTLLLTPNAPPALRREAARGLGFWPPALGLNIPVNALVSSFAADRQLDAAGVKEAEASLYFLTGERFRLPDAKGEETIVDVAAWTRWYADFLRKLEGGDAAKAP